MRQCLTSSPISSFFFLNRGYCTSSSSDIGLSVSIFENENYLFISVSYPSPCESLEFPSLSTKLLCAFFFLMFTAFPKLTSLFLPDVWSQFFKKSLVFVKLALGGPIRTAGICRSLRCSSLLCSRIELKHWNLPCVFHCKVFICYTLFP